MVTELCIILYLYGCIYEPPKSVVVGVTIIELLSVRLCHEKFSFKQEFGFMHLSAGDLLREARDSGSPDGKLIDDYIRNGEIVPVEITISLLQQVSL